MKCGIKIKIFINIAFSVIIALAVSLQPMITYAGASEIYSAEIYSASGSGREMSAESIRIMETVAKKYTIDSESLVSPWMAMILCDYAAVNPDTQYKITSKQKDEFIEESIETLNKSNSASDYAKYILAFAAMGEDPEHMVLLDGTRVDLYEGLVSRLNSLNGYGVPFVYMALAQNEKYGTEQRLDMLAQRCINNIPANNNVSDIDLVSFTLPALAMISDNGDAQEAIDRGIGIIRNNIWTGNAENIGNAMAALAACGIDPLCETRPGEDDAANGLENALLKFANDSGFTFNGKNNAISDEQAMRGLVAALGFHDGGYNIFDMTDMPDVIAYVTPGPSENRPNETAPAAEENNPFFTDSLRTATPSANTSATEPPASTTPATEPPAATESASAAPADQDPSKADIRRFKRTKLKLRLKKSPSRKKIRVTSMRVTLSWRMPSTAKIAPANYQIQSSKKQKKGYHYLKRKYRKKKIVIKVKNRAVGKLYCRVRGTVNIEGKSVNTKWARVRVR